MFGLDLRTPTEAAILPDQQAIEEMDLDDYREELVLSMSSAREMASTCIAKAQANYKRSYDKQSKAFPLRVGDWAFVRFPHEESRKNRKLSQPWHGPYRVVDKNDPDVTVVQV
jgi:hypothetical protein